MRVLVISWRNWRLSAWGSQASGLQQRGAANLGHRFGHAQGDFTNHQAGMLWACPLEELSSFMQELWSFSKDTPHTCACMVGSSPFSQDGQATSLERPPTHLLLVSGQKRHCTRMM